MGKRQIIILNRMLGPVLFFLCSVTIMVHDVCGELYLIRTDDEILHHGLEESEQDYGLFITSKSKRVSEGEDAKLKCETLKKFENCFFKDPDGKIHTVITRSKIALQRFMGEGIEDLSKEEKYDKNKGCGIIIRKANKMNQGEWTCIFEWKEGGKIKKEKKSYKLTVEKKDK